ncbi:replication initiation protein [uncultured Nostoc sp.]|uniref:replication initiation protein n=1 Tax=uncultured Nostoc sp. TaxID=340711 RepID=UPI0035CC8923
MVNQNEVSADPNLRLSLVGGGISTDTRPDRAIAQHNVLIKAQYDMSLIEMRLFIAMLARINRGDIEFYTCKIPVSELYPEEKVGGKTYAQVKKSVVKLVSRSITVETVDERGKREFVSNPLMATCRYKEGSGYVEAQFNNFVKPYLLELKGDFTVAQELTLIEFRSFYSFRMYWLLKLSSFYKDIIKLDLPILKQMLNLTNKYSNFADFKRSVLDIAQGEMSSTDMAFDYKPIKEGRTITGLSFNLLRPMVVSQEDTELPDGVQQKLNQIGITLKSLQEIKAKYKNGKLSDDYIRFVLNYYDQSNTKSRIRSLAAVIYKALMTDQLTREFEASKASQPTYKAPAKKTTTIDREEIIPLDIIRSGWETMHKKGLTEYETFEENLLAYQKNPAYRFEVVNGVECLIYTKE